MILIEPQWNVDLKKMESTQYIMKILIEPQWNVDIYAGMRSFNKGVNFNRTIVECRSKRDTGQLVSDYILIEPQWNVD